jgi:hypothetical protein
MSLEQLSYNVVEFEFEEKKERNVKRNETIKLGAAHKPHPLFPLSGCWTGLPVASSSRPPRIPAMMSFMSFRDRLRHRCR